MHTLTDMNRTSDDQARPAVLLRLQSLKGFRQEGPKVTPPSRSAHATLMNSWDFDDPALQTLERPDGSYHIPVMAEEVVALLRPAPGLIFLDGTAGGGGHSEKLLQYGAEVIALDQDADAIAMCRAATRALRAAACISARRTIEDVEACS